VWRRRLRKPYLVFGWGWFVISLLPVIGLIQVGIQAYADRTGTLVLMPDQKKTANPFRCWNWFDGRTVAGKGEAAIVAAMIGKVVRRCHADPARVLAAGISSGGALAAILGLRFPRVVRGVAVHSGIACGAAASVFTAMTVMRRGPETDVAAIARAARERAESAGVPLLVIQGRDDTVVAARNAAGLARQYLAFNGVPVPAGSESTLPPPDLDHRDAVRPLRDVQVREWRRDGTVVVRLIEVDGLGHAWSGGDATLPFNDAAPPDATTLVGEWLAALPAR
jgi:poly(hydroxyalkanoate) depolymerase family esterase